MKKSLLLILVLLTGFLTAGKAGGAMSESDFADLCRTGTPREVEAAITDGADFRAEAWETPLAAAVENPDPEVVSVLLKNGAGVTPKVLASAAEAKNPNPKAFAILLENGGDINARHGYESLKTPLIYAAEAEDPNLEFIAFLLKNGAEVNAKAEQAPDYESSDGPGERIEIDWTALLYAAGAESPNPELVAMLLENGADANAQGGSTGVTPLMAALSNRYCNSPWQARTDRDVSPEVLALLLKNGAEVNARDRKGWTPLVYAADNSLEAVVTLLENGAEVNAKDNDGRTPLMSAAEGSYTPNYRLGDGEVGSDPETVAVLIENGAEVNARDNEGRTPLMIAAEGAAGASPGGGGPNPETIAILLENGAEINAVDNEGRTALMIAADSLYYFNADAVEAKSAAVTILLTSGANVKLADKEGRTVLDYADDFDDADNKRKFAELIGGADETSRDEGQVISLEPRDADLSEAPNLIVEPSEAPFNLGGWRASNLVAFPVEAKTAGDYLVTLVYSKQESDGDQADLKISAGRGQSISGPLPVTGSDWSDYREYDFGVLTLPAGPTSLSLESTDPRSGRYVMNLRAVRLTPKKRRDFSAAELKLMGAFLSNMTGQGLMNFETKKLVAAQPQAELIEFGIWHNYTHNYSSRVRRCPVENCRWGSLTIDGKYVAEIVKKYFDVDLKLVSVTESDHPYHYDGKLYHFEGAGGEAVYHARVDEARSEASGHIRMSGELYNADDETRKLGQFEALAKPYKYGEKRTWAILSLKTEYYE